MTIGLADGTTRTCLDFMSAFGSVNFGHSNTDICSRITKGPDVSGLCYPPEAEELAAWLCARLDRPEAKVLFQVGGSFSVSTALAISQRVRPGRVVAVAGAFHGLGLDSLAITSVQKVFALHDTALARCVQGQMHVLRPGETVDTWDGVSCFIYEPVQGANGYVPLDASWLLAIEQAARAAGVITISDEIQAGFHRHGPFSPSKSSGLSPDITLFSKSLTNGMYPLSAVVYAPNLDPPQEQPFLAHTFQTGTYGYYAGAAVASYLDDFPVAGASSSIELTFADFVAAELGSDVANGVHVNGPTLSFEPRRMPAREVVRAALDHGLIIASGGSAFERLRVAPPLTIAEDDLDRGLQVLATVLRAGSSEHAPTAPGSIVDLRPSDHQDNDNHEDRQQMTMAREDFYQRVRKYLVDRADNDGRVIEPSVIHDTANLFDLGLVNSFSMVQLLLHVEDCLQVEIDVTDHEPETFFTLAGMYASLATVGDPA